MKALFDVSGDTAADLREQAARVLQVFDPEAKWKVYIEARPIAENGMGQILSWRGEVYAHDQTDRQA